MKSLSVRFSINTKLDSNDKNVKQQNFVEFISEMSKFCNGIIDCKISNLNVSSISLVADSLADIIKSQPLERIVLNGTRCMFRMSENVENVKKIVNVLEFRSETLKALRFYELNFKHVNLSCVPKMERLERLEFVGCMGFERHYDKKELLRIYRPLNILVIIVKLI